MNGSSPAPEYDIARVRTFLATHNLACDGCGYNLRGLEGPKCPECGRPVRLPDSDADDPRIEAEVSAYLLKRDLRCKRCGYNLRGIGGNRCPECGTTYMLVGRSGIAALDPDTVPGSNVLAGLSVLGWIGTFVFWLRGVSCLSRNQPVAGWCALTGACLCLTITPVSILWCRRARRLRERGNGLRSLEVAAIVILCLGMGFAGVVLGSG